MNLDKLERVKSAKLDDPNYDISIKNQLCMALYVTANRASRLIGRELSKLGLTFPQYLVLLILLDRGQSSVGDICEILDVDASTVTLILKRLQAQGYVIRFRDRLDERRVFAALTEKGQAFETSAREFRKECVVRMGIQVEDLALVREKLKGLGRALNQLGA